MRTVRVALVGFGNVGQALADLLNSGRTCSISGTGSTSA